MNEKLSKNQRFYLQITHFFAAYCPKVAHFAPYENISLALIPYQA